MSADIMERLERVDHVVFSDGWTSKVLAGLARVYISTLRDKVAHLESEARILSALLPAQTEPDAGRVEEAAPQADLVTESEVYAALRGWQKAIIDAPEEGVEERRRRCMRAALKAARACSSAQSRQATPPSPPREEIEHQGVVAVGVEG